MAQFLGTCREKYFSRNNGVLGFWGIFLLAMLHCEELKWQDLTAVLKRNPPRLHVFRFNLTFKKALVISADRSFELRSADLRHIFEEPKFWIELTVLNAAGTFANAPSDLR